MLDLTSLLQVIEKNNNVKNEIKNLLRLRKLDFTEEDVEEFFNFVENSTYRDDFWWHNVEDIGVPFITQRRTYEDSEGCSVDYKSDLLPVAEQLFEIIGWYTPDGYNFYQDKETFKDTLSRTGEEDEDEEEFEESYKNKRDLKDLVDLWPEYEVIRKRGNYNMFTDGQYAAAEMGIDLETYFDVLNNYSTLKNMYEKKNKGR